MRPASQYVSSQIGFLSRCSTGSRTNVVHRLQQTYLCAHLEFLKSQDEDKLKNVNKFCVLKIKETSTFLITNTFSKGISRTKECYINNSKIITGHRLHRGLHLHLLDTMAILMITQVKYKLVGSQIKSVPK